MHRLRHFFLWTTAFFGAAFVFAEAFGFGDAFEDVSAAILFVDFVGVLTAG